MSNAINSLFKKSDFSQYIGVSSLHNHLQIPAPTQSYH